tara:strand:- start:1041 stop:2063 length:1023 start_codon:yes stop_codon:yes gene_type:complete
MMRSIIHGPPQMLKVLYQMTSKKMGTAGISLSMASMLKQSQLFTGAAGGFFQIIGAFFDAVLAPFMPFLFKVMGLLARGIPYFQKASQWVYDKIAAFLGWIWDWLGPFVGIIWDGLKWIFGKIWEGIGKLPELWNFIKSGDIFKWIWSKITSKEFWGSVKTFIENIGTAIADFGFWLIDKIKKIPVFGFIGYILEVIWIVITNTYKAVWKVATFVTSVIWDFSAGLIKFIKGFFKFDWVYKIQEWIMRSVRFFINGLNNVIGLRGKFDDTLVSLDKTIADLNKKAAGGTVNGDGTIVINNNVNGVTQSSEVQRFHKKAAANQEIDNNLDNSMINNVAGGF